MYYVKSHVITSRSYPFYLVLSLLFHLQFYCEAVSRVPFVTLGAQAAKVYISPACLSDRQPENLLHKCFLLRMSDEYRFTY